MGNELRWRYECDRSCCASFTGKSGRPIRNKVAAYGTWHGLCFGAAVFVKLFKVSSIRLRLILVLGMIALVGSSLAGGVLFKALSYNISHQEITELTGKVDLISRLAELQEHHMDVTAFLKSIATLLKGPEYQETSVIDPEGNVDY